MVQAIPEKINGTRGLVNEWLQAHLLLFVAQDLLNAGRYAVHTGGKRFRPVLAVFVSRALGLDTRTVRPLAIALEFLHTASLIHDDLPALDNDIERRGFPTVHRKFGEAVAVLTGDALISEAFRVVAADQTAAPEVRIELLRVLAETNSAICAGQVLDLESAGGAREEPAALQNRHLLKTGALIRAAAACPALLACPVKREVYDALGRYGELLGLLFQITDDLLDAQAPSGGSDSRLGLQTFVTLFGIEGARAKADETAALAKEALESVEAERGDLTALVDYVLNRSS